MPNPNTNKPAAMPAWANYLIGESKRHPDTTDFARALITGEFGSGKTHFANTFPKPFFIDVDYGLSTTKTSMTAKSAPGIRLFPGDPVYQTIMSLINDAKQKREPLDGYETIVLDGMTSLSRLLLFEITGGNLDPKTGQKPGYDEYGSLKTRLASIVTQLQSVPFHVVATALTEIDKDEATGSYVGLINTVGSFGKDVGSLFDEVYYVEKRRARNNEPGDAVHEFFTEYHPRFAVKSRLQRAAQIPPKIVNPTFDSLYGNIYKREGK
jgi:hypothetical protein